MTSATLARWEARLRPLASRLPASLAVRLYSWGRRRFLARFAAEPPPQPHRPAGLGRTLWGVAFGAPLLNAAGVFKSGDGYPLVVHQGAGGYLAGTTTGAPRQGNTKGGVALPFAPYPRSHAASNWLGLPNPGHRAVAARLAALERVEGCPVGVSVAACPDPARAAAERIDELVAGLELYREAGVDFLEMNESCPNTGEPEAFGRLEERLRAVAAGFLGRRPRPPVVVKLSCDTAVEQLPRLLGDLLELGFDGVNFGNTSTAYARCRAGIAAPERRLYDHFTGRYGGGVSGRPLGASSLALVEAAAAFVARRAPAREFHVVRTGGVETAADVRRSLAAGAALCQWYTGYFEAFGRYGHGLYRELYRGLG